MTGELRARIEELKRKLDVVEKCGPKAIASAVSDLRETIFSLDALERDISGQGLWLDGAPNPDAALQKLIARSSDRFFLQDRHCRYLWLSHGDAFGIPASDILGRSDQDFFSLEESARLREIKSKVMENRLEIRVETHTSINGEERYFDSLYMPWQDRNGDVIGVAIHSRDITEAKAAETLIKKMTTAVETAPTAIVLTDLQGKIEYVNPGLLEMGGFDDDSPIVGRSVFEFTDQAGESRLNEEIIPALYSQGQWRGEFPVLGRDRRPYITELICSLVRDEFGCPSYFLANFYNITERMRAEEALLLDESRLEALLKLNQMDDASLQEITDFALEAGVKLTNSRLGYLAFVDQEEKTLAMHSWSKEAMVECQAHKQIIYAVDQTGLWGEAVRQRQPMITNNYIASPYRRGLPKGHVKIRRHLNIPVFDRGRIVAVAGVGNKEEPYDESDIRQLTLLMTGMWRIIQRHQAEEALKESQRMLSTLMSNLPGMAYRSRNDRNWTMEFVSDGCLDLTGHRPEELIGNRSTSYGDLIHPEDREYVWNRVQEAVAEKRPFRLLYRLRSIQGIKWVWGMGQGIFSANGDLLFLEGFATDITDRKLAEEALQRANDELEKRVEERTAWLVRANEALHEEMMMHKETEFELRRAQLAADAASRAKSDFLANMSHEIRTPMNAVIGMAGLLLETDLSSEQKDYVETIKDSGDILLAVINDILDFSKIDQGKMEIENRPFDVEECVESSLAMVAAKASGKGIEISYCIDSRIAEVLMGDSARLRQVLVNLLSNAVKFTEKGKVEVSVVPGQGREVHFQVKDSGIGISEESMAKLFQSFCQVDSSTSRKYGGTGLGLAISKRLVELMGGRIWVESVPGQGSTFHFSIKAETDRGIVQDRRLMGKSLLGVVGSQNDVQGLVDPASRWGMKVVIASSAADARAALAKERFDAVIIDEKMDGSRELIREMDGSLPLIMLATLQGYAGHSFQSRTIKVLRLHSALVDSLVPAPLTRISPEEDVPSSFALRVLLAEDNPVNQKVALLMLKRLGYRADLAADGREVLRAVKERDYDVVLMDVQMPEMDGLEAARAIRLCQDLNQPAILAMTAYALQGDRDRCLAAGMDGYISKPVQLNDLRQALEDLEKKKSQNR